MQQSPLPQSRTPISEDNIRARGVAQRAIHQLPPAIAEPLESVLGLAMLYVDRDAEQTLMFSRIRGVAQRVHDALLSAGRCDICDAEGEVGG